MATSTIEMQNLLASDFAASIRDFQDLMTDYAAEQLVWKLFGSGRVDFDEITNSASTALVRVTGSAALKLLVRQLYLDRAWVSLRAAYFIFADAGESLRAPPPSICDGFIKMLLYRLGSSSNCLLDAQSRRPGALGRLWINGCFRLFFSILFPDTIRKIVFTSISPDFQWYQRRDWGF